MIFEHGGKFNAAEIAFQQPFLPFLVPKLPFLLPAID